MIKKKRFLFILIPSLILPSFVIIKYGVSLTAMAILPYSVVSFAIFRKKLVSKEILERAIGIAALSTILYLMIFAISERNFRIVSGMFSHGLLALVLAAGLFLITRGGFSIFDLKTVSLQAIAFSVFPLKVFLIPLVGAFLVATLFSAYLLARRKATTSMTVAFTPIVVFTSWISLFYFISL